VTDLGELFGGIPQAGSKWIATVDVNTKLLDDNLEQSLFAANCEYRVAFDPPTSDMMSSTVTLS